MVLPNNSGNISDNIKKHEFFAKITAMLGYVFFGGLDTIILVPAFSRPAEHRLIYTHALDRDVLQTDITDLKRLDLQLLAMIDETRDRYEKQGWKVDDRVLMWGFSASGMFTNRFVALHPERVQAAFIGAPGGWPIAPVSTWQGKKLRYPVGINDLQALTGEALNLEEYKKVPQLFYLGDKDTNDSVPYSDSYEDEDRELIYGLFGNTPVERWGTAEKIYAKIGANTTFILGKGVGHMTPIQSLRQAKVFFQEALKRR